MKYIIFLFLVSISFLACAQDSTLIFHIQNGGDVFTKIDTMPRFKGDIYQYYQSYRTYPEQERDAGISGTVYVGFVVEQDGTLDSIKVLKGVDKGLDWAAIQMVKTMPKFIPGIKNGNAVRVQYSIPVSFILRP